MPSVPSGAPAARRLVPIVHADDCGLSRGITDAILACHDHGTLHRTSVIANGAAWEYAVAALGGRPHLAPVLHLNLFEGAPLSPPPEVDLLVDSRGRFDRSFAALLARGVAGPGRKRLGAQVQCELRRQIERFLQAFGSRGPLSIDGHVHYHVIPVVLNELLTLCSDYPIGAIRLPREPLYWPMTPRAPRPRLGNLGKHLVLQLLSRRAAPLLDKRSLQTTDAFVGVLATGEMTLAHVRAALAHLRHRGTCGSVEILFHPGRARPDEAWLWNDRPELAAVYLSAARDREGEVLRSAELAHLLREYEVA